MTPNPGSCFPWNPDTRIPKRYFKLNISQLENWFPPPNLLLPQHSPFQRAGPPNICAKPVHPPTPVSKWSGSTIHLLAVGAPEWERRQTLMGQSFASRGSKLQLGQWFGRQCGGWREMLAIFDQIFFHLLEKVWGSKSWENVHNAVVVRKKKKKLESVKCNRNRVSVPNIFQVL